MPGGSSLVVGVDVGGTFTDIIVQGDGGLKVVKLPTTRNPSRGIIRGLSRLCQMPESVELVSHATTLATNALLTRTSLARCALITNEGFRDVLEIGRQRRPDLYSLNPMRPPPLVERKSRLTARCRISADGKELESLADSEARRLATNVVDQGYDSVAVCFLNSYLAGSHEVKMRRALRDAGFRGQVSLSSEVDREYREYERTSTTVVNAVLSPLMAGYMQSLKRLLAAAGVKAPLYVMNSDGGSSTLGQASAFPVAVIESGPAAGVVASKLLAKRLSLDRVLTFDMGGTTAKAGAVIDGEPDIINEFEAAGRTHSGRSIRGSGYPVRGPFIDLAEVSAGGGTIAWLDEGGELQVGPQSAGAYPGPACYGRGGTRPTVTDANVALGRLNSRALLGGQMRISLPLALRSLRGLSQTLGSNLSETSRWVLRLVNNAMARAISLVSVERGRDPRDFVLFAFGGAGPVHACDLAEEMGIAEVVTPIHAGLFSAHGLLAGELTRTFTSPVMAADVPLGARFRDLEHASRMQLKSEGFPRFTFRRYVEARYVGQSHELQLPYTTGENLKTSFHARHRALYGYSTSERVEVVSIKVRATAARRVPAYVEEGSRAPSTPPFDRRAWIGGAFRTVKVLTRESLRPGDGGRGPCIIEEYDSTLVVNPSWHWEATDYGTRLMK